MLGISAKLGLLNAKQVTDNCENLFEVLSTFAGLILVSQAEVRIRENLYKHVRKTCGNRRLPHLLPVFVNVVSKEHRKIHRDADMQGFVTRKCRQSIMK